MSRLRDEVHRVDNLSDHALRATSGLEKLNQRMEWADSAQQDVKTMAEAVGGGYTRLPRKLNMYGPEDMVNAPVAPDGLDEEQDSYSPHDQSAVRPAVSMQRAGTVQLDEDDAAAASLDSVSRQMSSHTDHGGLSQ